MNVVLIENFKHTDSQKFGQAQKIRETVFVEEQKIAPELEMDEFDEKAEHYLVTINGTAVGAARWRLTDKGAKLERFAILQAFRKLKLGGLLLYRILSDVAGHDHIYLHAQESVVDFYRKFGFEVRSEAFFEAGVKHYLMVLE